MLKNRTFLLIIGFFFIFSIIFFKISAPDFWWHAAYGNYYLHYGFPLHDPFSFVTSAKPFYQTFVSDIILFLSYNIFHVYGIYLVKLFILISIFFLFYKMEVDIITMGIMFLAISFRLFARPEIFSLLFFTIFIILYEKNPKNRWFFVFMVALIWNQHHSAILSSIIFPLSYFLNGIFKRKMDKSYIVDFFLILLAFIINPSGLRNLFFYLNLFNSNSFAGDITEWIPFFSSHFPVSLFYLLLFIFLLVFFIYFLVISLIKRKDISLHIIGLFYLILTLLSRRFLVYFALILVIPLSNFIKKLNKITKYSTLFLLIFLFFINLFNPKIRMPLERGIGFNSVYDFRIIKLFKDFTFRDNIFNDYDIGGFLTFNLNRKVFIYGINLNKNKLKDYINFVNGKNIDSIIQKYHIRTIILKPLNFYPGGGKIKMYLLKNKFQYFGYIMRYEIWTK